MEADLLTLWDFSSGWGCLIATQPSENLSVAFKDAANGNPGDSA